MEETALDPLLASKQLCAGDGGAGATLGAECTGRGTGLMIWGCPRVAPLQSSP